MEKYFLNDITDSEIVLILFWNFLCTLL